MIIISGYQGVGKSTYAKVSQYKVIDFESSNYDKKDEQWYKKYVQDILKQDCDIILISSHLAVREELNRLGKPFYFILPSSYVENDWTYHLALRVRDDGFKEKDIRALMSHILNFENVMNEIDNGRVREFESVITIERVERFKLIVDNLALVEFKSKRKENKK